jgi:hypothetical protein
MGNIRAAIDRNTARIAHKVERALINTGVFVLNASSENVPLEVMALRESGRTRQKFSGFNTIVYVGYAAPDFYMTGVNNKGEMEERHPADYAVIVHEDVEAYHEHGSAKYLEMVTVGMRDEIAEYFREQVVRNV